MIWETYKRTRNLLESIEKHLEQDWTALVEQEGLMSLNAASDSVLAELWENELDAAYEAIPPTDLAR